MSKTHVNTAFKLLTCELPAAAMLSPVVVCGIMVVERSLALSMCGMVSDRNLEDLLSSESPRSEVRSSVC